MNGIPIKFRRDLVVLDSAANGRKEDGDVEIEFIAKETGSVSSSSEKIPPKKESFHINERKSVATITHEDIISELLLMPFGTRTPPEQAKIIKNGRPVPVFHEGFFSWRDSDMIDQTISRNLYYSIKWLAYSETRARLFCWTCLLFPIDRNDWYQDGFKDVQNVQRIAARHSKSKHHISSSIKFNRFKNQLSSHDIPDENDSFFYLTANREVFKRLLNGWILFIILPTKNLVDKSEFYDYLFEHDVNLNLNWLKLKKEPVKLANIMKGISHSVRSFVAKRINYEINNARFFSVIVDDQPAGRISVVIRFVDLKGEVCERLIGLFPISDRTAESLYLCLNSALLPFNYRYKMVSYSFSGGCLSVDQINSMISRIVSSNRESMFLNCSYHRLCETIAAGCYTIQETRVMFSAIKTFPRFLIDVLKKTANDSLSGKLQSNSDVKSTISFILERRKALIKFFLELEGLNQDTMNLSCFYLALLKENDFLCLLVAFNTIFASLGVIDLSDECINESTDYNSVNDIETLTKMCEAAVKRLGLLSTDNGLAKFVNALARFEILPNESHVQLFKELIANTISHLDARFQNLASLKILELVDSRRFSSHSLEFPTEAFSKLSESFKKVFDFTQLRNELEIVYSDPSFRCGSPADIMKLIKNSNFQDDLSETTKLLVLTLTMPPTYGTVDSLNVAPSSLLQKVRDYVDAELPPELNIIFANEELLLEMKKSFTWYEDIMKLFAQSEYGSNLKVF